MPYTKGLSESCRNIRRKHGINFKEDKTIKTLLVTPKDKDTIFQKSRVIYRFKCGRVVFEEYIGESGRKFGERFKEYQKAPIPIYNHCNTAGHTTTVENLPDQSKKPFL